MTTEQQPSEDSMRTDLADAMSVSGEAVWRPDPSRFVDGCPVHVCADGGNHFVAIVDGPDGREEDLADYVARLGRTASLLRQVLLDAQLHRLLVLLVRFGADVYDESVVRDWLLDPRVRRSDEVVRLVPVDPHADEERWHEELSTVADFKRRGWPEPASVDELIAALRSGLPNELQANGRDRLISDLTRMLTSDDEVESGFVEIVDWLDSFDTAGEQE